MSTSGASADLLRLLAGFVETPRDAHPGWAAALGLVAPESLAAWRTRHAQSFVEQCYPFASVYLGSEGSIGGEAADRVAGFRGLLGSGIDGSPDALAPLLADYAALVVRSESDPRARHARKAMLWEHLLCWLTPFLDSVVRVAPAPYAPWASMVRDVFVCEATLLGDPGRMPLHLREAPIADIGTHANSLDDVAGGLLVPVRSGVVLTRHDLSRIADEVGVAMHVGSRRLLLRSLLEQQPMATLQQLADEAARQAHDHARDRAALGSISDFWSERAFATAAALDAMGVQVSAAAIAS